ncbi:hypothetical protein [Sphingomonas turrisvirgatae]|uniref:Acid phosphatase n=1 Tax=Sphingomonas turrisvirgatae TaxID=1888892 RepID=A0A1E3LXQ3_9SPHN|nr:hypothetical protein [Sphingomonas turrisvirgatae]ODP38526.1 hypothetical protein BFL28_00290 [Sphingomonas turrisvirgatae]
MIRLRAALVMASASLLIHGCVAAAIPLAAGGAIARGERSKAREARSVAVQADDPASAPLVVTTTLTALPPPGGAAGEHAAEALQGYQGLWTYLAAQAAKRARGEPLRSAVLDTGAALAAPRYVACDKKPLAMLVDIDEDAAKSADPDARWRRWNGDARDAIVAAPGALEGVEAARREGIAVIFTSARSPESATGVIAALDQLGFGRLELGKTLYLQGQASADAVRRGIAGDYCVIAIVGDAFEDFRSLLPASGQAQMQSMAVTDTMVAPLWGAGWFLLPSPVRSTAVPSINPTGGK